MSEPSLCDSCPKPGKCCVGFDLNHPVINRLDSAEEVTRVMKTIAHDFEGKTLAVSMNPFDRNEKGWRVGFPFRPLWKRSQRIWRFWCMNLNIKTGRCNDYANRPALCRAFKPASDPLCILYEPPVPKPESANTPILKEQTIV